MLGFYANLFAFILTAGGQQRKAAIAHGELYLVTWRHWPKYVNYVRSSVEWKTAVYVVLSVSKLKCARKLFGIVDLKLETAAKLWSTEDPVTLLTLIVL